jgi:7-cyano-7-deazaguanine synthase
MPETLFTREVRCVLLLSGGIDSVSVIPRLHDAGVRIHPMFCDYGQQSAANERRSANYCSHALETEPLKTVRLDLWKPDSHELLSGRGANATPTEFFVPYRNLALATAAAVYADEIGAELIAFGFNSDGAYSDTGSEFADSLESVLRLSGRSSVRVWRDPLSLSKADLVEFAIRANAPLEATYSCYRAERCGECPSCVAVSDAFRTLEGRVDTAALAKRNPNRGYVERPPLAVA